MKSAFALLRYSLRASYLLREVLGSLEGENVGNLLQKLTILRAPESLDMHSIFLRPVGLSLHRMEKLLIRLPNFDILFPRGLQSSENSPVKQRLVVIRDSRCSSSLRPKYGSWLGSSIGNSKD